MMRHYFLRSELANTNLSLIICEKGEHIQLNLDHLTNYEADTIAAAAIGRLRQLLPIDNLELSARAKNMCRIANITTLGDLQLMTSRQIARLPNCGRRTRHEVVENVQKEWGVDLTNWREEREEKVTKV